MTADMFNEESDSSVEKLKPLLTDIRIDTKIDILRRKLKSSNELVLDGEKTNITLEDIAREIDEGTIDKNYINDLYYEVYFKETDPNKKLLKSLYLAHIYTYVAVELQRHGHLMMAWNAVSDAYNHIGACDMLVEILKNPKTRRASKGGTANAKKISDFKSAVIDALQKFSPANGWPSSAVATDKIIAPLIHITSPSKSDDLAYRNDQIAKVRNMIESDKDVKAAFNQKRKNKKNHI